MCKEWNVCSDDERTITIQIPEDDDGELLDFILWLKEQNRGGKDGQKRNSSEAGRCYSQGSE
jgi:hypothetical protein